MKAGAAALLAPLALLAALAAGCSQPPPSAPPPDAHAPECRATAVAGACVDLATVKVAFEDCLDSRFSVILADKEIPVPPGYEPLTQAGRQFISLSLGRCDRVSFGGVSGQNVSFAQVGLRLRPPADAPAADRNLLVLETASDWEPLAALFAAAGFPTLNASVATAEGTATRHTETSGDVLYSADFQYAPLGDRQPVLSPDFPTVELHHLPGMWYVEEDTCKTYFGAAALEFTATKGAAVAAMPSAGPSGPMAWYDALPIRCHTQVTFEVPVPVGSDSSTLEQQGLSSGSGLG